MWNQTRTWGAKKKTQEIQADENDQSEYTNMHNQLTTCLFCDSLLMGNEIRFVRDEKKKEYANITTSLKAASTVTDGAKDRSCLHVHDNQYDLTL